MQFHKNVGILLLLQGVFPYPTSCLLTTIVLVTRTDTSNARSIMDLLQQFSAQSGLKVNGNKSNIYLSRNVSQQLKQDILNILPYRPTESFDTYLDFPLTNGQRAKASDIQFLIDKFNSKLVGWKAMNLSMVGRVVLAKSIIEAIPNYYS